VLAILNIGPLELLLLGAAAVLLFGGDLPDVARKAARLAGRLRGMTNDLTREFKENTDFEDKLRRPPQLDQPPLEKKFSVSDWRPVNSPPGSGEETIEVANEGDVDGGGDTPPDAETTALTTPEGGDPGEVTDSQLEASGSPALASPAEGGAASLEASEASSTTKPVPVEPNASDDAGDEKPA